jgi:hypothetical protein
MPWIITSPPNGSVIEDANGTLWTQLGGDGPGLLFPTATLTLVGNALWEITSNSPQTQQNRQVQLLGYGDGVPQQGYVLWEGVESDIPSVLNLFGLPFDSLRLRYILPNGCEYLSDVLTTIPEDPNGCGTIQFEVGEPVVENGLFTVAVTLSNQQGYPLGACLLSLNDGDPVEGPVLVVGENILGPFALGNTLQITITNIANSECNIPLEPIATECPVLVVNTAPFLDCAGDPPTWGTLVTPVPNDDFPVVAMSYTTPLATDPVACVLLSPGVFGCGPLPTSGVNADSGPMTITIESAINKDCEVVLGPFEPSGCGPCDIAQETEGCQYFTFDFAGGSANILAGATVEGGNYLTVVFPDGSTETREGQVVLEDDIGGRYCVYSSDSEGEPIADTWALNLSILGSFESEISNLDLSGVFGIVGSTALNSGLTLSFVELDAGSSILMEGLTFFSASDCIVGSGFIVLSSAMEFFAIQSCIMSEAPSVTGYPNMKTLSFSDNQLPVSEVNKVLIEASATFLEPEGDIILWDQTPPAPPSGAGLTAKAELEGRSPGWTVTVDT